MDKGFTILISAALVLALATVALQALEMLDYGIF